MTHPVVHGSYPHAAMNPASSPAMHLFKSMLADFPAGIVLVTTCDASGEWRGVTTSSFCGVLLDPAIVSACLHTTADCYRAFREATLLCVSLLRAGHQAVAAGFATKGGDKFAFGDFVHRGRPRGSLRHRHRDPGQLRHTYQPGPARVLPKAVPAHRVLVRRSDVTA